jgi:thiol-disulfide isomerase/thioredoxin
VNLTRSFYRALRQRGRRQYAARMRPRSAGYLGIVVLLTLVVTGCTALTRSDRQQPANESGSLNSVGVTTYQVGNRPTLPALGGTTLQGAPLQLKSLLGHVVVLNTWASWCYPCRAESPALAKIAADSQHLGVRFVGIDEQDNTIKAVAFVTTTGATYPQLIDSDGKLLQSLRLVPPSAIPSTLVLDSSGFVAARIIGPIDPATFASVVTAVVDGK